MTPQDTIEAGNVLIAAFDQRKFYGHTINNFGEGTFNKLPEMKYHTSWDWLMPVCKKLESLPDTENFNDADYNKWVENSECLGEALWTCDIEAVWQACVQFIVWWNQNK